MRNSLVLQGQRMPLHLWGFRVLEKTLMDSVILSAGTIESIVNLNPTCSTLSWANQNFFLLKFIPPLEQLDRYWHVRLNILFILSSQRIVHTSNHICEIYRINVFKHRHCIWALGQTPHICNGQTHTEIWLPLFFLPSPKQPNGICPSCPSVFSSCSADKRMHKRTYFEWYWSGKE